MSAKYSDIVNELGVSKPTVIKIAKELDPKGEHTTLDGRTVIMDDFLASAVANELVKKGFTKKEKTQDEAGEDSQDSSQHRPLRVIRGPKTVSEQEKETIQETVQELCDRLLKSEAEKNQILIQTKDDQIERLMGQVQELSGRVERLEEKVEAERARYDALQQETFKALSAPKPGFFRRLLGWPKKQESSSAGE